MSLVDTINALCLERLGREPDLENPKGFNDLIQWLKVHDQRKEHIAACDKWAVRQMVPKENRIPAHLGIDIRRFPCVMKCTHDCGSVQIVGEADDLGAALKSLRDSLTKPYGVEKGEWAYKFVKPRIVTEQLLEPGITDYKFHCSHGQVRWVQVIRDRNTDIKESLYLPNGEVLPLHMDQNMVHAPGREAYPGDHAWQAMSALARRLAAPWRYVRVDLYWARGKAWFGELTFWPLAGCYMTDDEPVLGEMLQLDLSQRMEPIVK